MLFLSILFAAVISRDYQEAQQDQSFKDNMAAVELFQQMEGNWEFEMRVVGGYESQALERFVGSPPLPLLVSDYTIKQTIEDTEVAIYECIGFDADLNAFVLRNVVDSSCDKTRLATINDGKLVIVSRRDKTTEAPDSTQPKENNKLTIWSRVETQDREK